MAEAGRKISGQWVKWLRDEMTVWVEEGLLERQQAAVILQRYADQQQEESEGGGKLVTVLAVMGVLLLGIGVILFFAANWQAMTRVFKTTLVLGSIVITYGTGYYLAFEKANYPRIGRSLIFLGSLLYGAGIWLIAQIFQINSHYPNGVLLWALGLLPVLLVCGSIAILCEVSLLLTLWTILEQTGFASINGLYLPLFALLIYLGLKLRSRLAIGVTLPGLLVWLAISNWVTIDNSDQFSRIPYSVFLIALTGLLINLLTVFSQWRQLLQLPGRIVGISAFFSGLFLLSFRSIFRDFGENSNLPYPEFFLVTVAIILLFTVIAGMWVLLKTAGKKEAILTLLASFILLALFFLTPYTGEKTTTLAINLLLFFAVIIVVISGYNNREPVLVNIGLIFFVLHIIARYFDFFWDMLPRSVFFMAGGLVLIIGGILLERQRRQIVRELQVKNHAG